MSASNATHLHGPPAWLSLLLTLVALGPGALPAQQRCWTLRSPTPAPSARIYHGMAYHPPTGKVVLFGGSDPKQQHFLNDTWTWDGAKWTQESPRNRPSARAVYSLAYHARTGKVVLFGGYDGSRYYQDTWTWDGKNWTRGPTKSPLPPARLSHALAADAAHGSVVLFGGLTASSTVLQDTWTWNGSGWRKESPKSPLPPARHAHDLAEHARTQTVVLFGGEAGNSQFGDTWTWNGRNWTQHRVSGPGKRITHAMALGGAGDVLLFGGVAGQQFLNDTWAWDGSRWSQKSPCRSPSARKNPDMACHDVAGRMVLFGGETNSSGLGDTWDYECRICQQPLPFGRCTAHCKGCPQIAPHGCPWAGNLKFAVDVTGAVPAKPGKPVAGFFSLGFVPLKRPLSMLPCQNSSAHLLSNLWWAFPPFPADIIQSGRSRFPIPIPAGNLRGLHFYVQFFELHRHCSACVVAPPVGASASKGLDVQIQ